MSADGSVTVVQQPAPRAGGKVPKQESGVGHPAQLGKEKQPCGKDQEMGFLNIPSCHPDDQALLGPNRRNSFLLCRPNSADMVRCSWSLVFKVRLRGSACGNSLEGENILCPEVSKH